MAVPSIGNLTIGLLFFCIDVDIKDILNLSSGNESIFFVGLSLHNIGIFFVTVRLLCQCEVQEFCN